LPVSRTSPLRETLRSRSNVDFGSDSCLETSIADILLSVILFAASSRNPFEYLPFGTLSKSTPLPQVVLPEHWSPYLSTCYRIITATITRITDGDSVQTTTLEGARPDVENAGGLTELKQGNAVALTISGFSLSKTFC
jgi:hypothetical protein